MYWDSMHHPNSVAEYSNMTNSIHMNPDVFPQNNPNLAKMGPVVRHEEVHALLSPTDVPDQIDKYFQQNPQAAETGRQGLIARGGDPTALAREAPAYVAQQEYLGQPMSAPQTYSDRMPPDIRKTYLSLIGQQ
jgi:hypothetical protein